MKERQTVIVHVNGITWDILDSDICDYCDENEMDYNNAVDYDSARDALLDMLPPFMDITIEVLDGDTEEDLKQAGVEAASDYTGYLIESVDEVTVEY